MKRSASSRRMKIELDADREVGREGVVDDGVDEHVETMTGAQWCVEMTSPDVDGLPECWEREFGSSGKAGSGLALMRCGLV
jgi:hypothetical protein